MTEHLSLQDYINDPLVQAEALDEAYRNALADFRYFCVYVMQMDGRDKKLPDFSHPAYDEAFAAHEVWMRLDGLGMMPRGTGKTTLWTELRNLWLGLKNPNLRLAIGSAKFENACKMLGVIRRWMVYHEGLREVFGPKGCLPARGDKNWGTVHELEFPRRTANFMEKTITAIGADQQITSTHYDVITADDLINKENYGSAEQMRSIEEWWKLTRALLVTGGRRLMIGTRWHFHDLYGNEIRRDEERTSAGKNSRMYVCRVPARDGKGKPRFPHKTEEVLAEDLEDLGPTLYAGQIDLDPVPEGTQILKESDLRKAFYVASDVLEKDPVTRKLRVKPEFDVAITCDLAASTEEDADRSAIVVTATDPDGDIYVLDYSAGRYMPSKCLDIVAAFRDRFGARYMLAEKGVLKHIYKSDILEWNRDHPHEKPLFFLDVEKGGGKGTHNDPILAMEPFVVAGKIHLLASQTEVLRELSMYPRWKLDDIADAICQRVRTPRRPRSKKRERSVRTPTPQERCHEKVMAANREWGWR